MGRHKFVYEADRIAREAYDRSHLSLKERCPPLLEYSTNFFILGKCKISQRKAAACKEYAEDMLKVKRGHLLNYRIPAFRSQMNKLIHALTLLIVMEIFPNF